MALKRKEKTVLIEKMGAVLSQSETVVLAEYRGLPVRSLEGLRRRARQAQVHVKVMKNTLARRAVADTPFAPLSAHMRGPLVYGVSADPVAAAKLFRDFAKENEAFVITGGALKSGVLTKQQVVELAAMPSRDELLARLLGQMQAPIAQFVRTANELPTALVRVLASVRDQKAA